MSTKKERSPGTSNRTRVLPSGTYLGRMAIGLSANLKLTGRNKGAQFVEHWGFRPP